MWIIGLCIVAVLVVYLTYWLNRWSNPKCNGVLPPGSMGLPLIGETLQLIVRSDSLDLHAFIKKRAQRYGPIFRTSLVGRPVVLSTDLEFNHYIVKQEGSLVEMWYLDTFAKFLGMEGENRMSALGNVHKYIRSITLNHLGADAVKEKLLPQMEEIVNKALQTWSSQPSVDMRDAASKMLLDFSARIFFSYDAEKLLQLKLSEKFANTLGCFMSFPLNIPGTTYHKCLKSQKEALSMLRKIVKEKITSPEKRSENLLDQAIDDMEKEKFLSEDFIVKLLFAILFASFETSVSVLLALKLLAEHPAALQELTDEHEAILKNRENPNSVLTWDEYKSMTFTFQVINEVLRMGNVSPGLLRKALKDIEFKVYTGYTVPAGWAIMLVNSALQVNPNTFKDPLAFNPRRWKDLDPLVVSKNFMPFGGGIRLCSGAEYIKAFMATFLHVLVTKYRWTNVKGGTIARTPALEFIDGLQTKFFVKNN